MQIADCVSFFTHGGAWCLRKDDPDFDFLGRIKIGDNVLIGTGAIVTKSFGNGVVIAGNPAKIITTMDDFKTNRLPYNVDTKQMNPKDKKVFT